MLFASVLSNPCHYLHQLPPRRYDLDREIPVTENSKKKIFIIKMLYLNSY